MQSFEDARNIILKNVKTVSPVLQPIAEAAGRVLAQDIVAPCDLPRWDNSAMDGYAVQAADCTAGAVLQVTDFIPAGSHQAMIPVEAGCAVKIMTGAAVPPGADAIVPIEDTKELAGFVEIVGPVKLNDHIRWHGEDISAGDLMIPAGKVLRPAEISLLAASGFARVSVYSAVRVAILATGDELVEIDAELTAGKIIDSNSPALAAAVSAIGGEPVRLGIARDTRESLRDKLRQGLSADVLITSAGVSAGDLDLVKDVLAELGVQPLFWKVAVKPGRPTAFGRYSEKPVFSLPGNPVSALLIFDQLVRPALLQMMGHQSVIRPPCFAELAEPVTKKPGRTFFIRVKLFKENGRLRAVSAGDQNTGILKTLIEANAVAILPSDIGTLAVGDLVQVCLLDDRDYGLVL